LDSSWLISFKKHVDKILKENQLLVNVEFKLRSPDSMKYFFERDDLLLFENFFQPQINDTQSVENDYIENVESFYSNINFVECFGIIVNKENKKMAHNLFLRSQDRLIHWMMT
jgi:hypothetical protein